MGPFPPLRLRLATPPVPRKNLGPGSWTVLTFALNLPRFTGHCVCLLELNPPFGDCIWLSLHFWPEGGPLFGAAARSFRRSEVPPSPAGPAN